MQAAVVSILNVKLCYAPYTSSGATNASEYFAKGATPITRSKSTARNHQVERLIRPKKKYA
jgi:hypothetical protein